MTSADAMGAIRALMALLFFEKPCLVAPADEVLLLLFDPLRRVRLVMARSHAFLERERRFTRDASHELRTPVTVVRGAVELLKALPETDLPAIRRPIAKAAPT